MRELTLPCSTAEEICLAVPSLQQLRKLRLSGGIETDGGGNAVMEALLGLPHLTSLECANFFVFASRVRRWYTDRPCCWEQLTAASISIAYLARLEVPPSTPLHGCGRRWPT